jgi:hypothetical protein
MMLRLRVEHGNVLHLDARLLERLFPKELSANLPRATRLTDGKRPLFLGMVRTDRGRRRSRYASTFP